MSVLSLAKKAPALGPEREVLSQILNRRIGLARDAAKAKNVLVRAQDLVQQATVAFEAASAAAGSARDDHRAAVLKSAQTGEPVPATSLTRELRHRLDDTRETVDAANAAVEAAQSALDEAEGALAEAYRQAIGAADAVIATAAESVVAAVDEAHKRFVRAILVAGQIRNAMPNSTDALHQAIRVRAESAVTHYPGLEADRARIKAQWDATRESLIANPAAPLPEIGGR